MSIKINHEVPKCLLTPSTTFNDYEFCLPHLLDQDEEYLNHFKEAKNKGRYIIMDNSLHELGEAYDHKRLLHWVNEIKPDEFIVPDVWQDMTQTIKNAKHWRQYKYPESTTLVAVVQADNLQEANIGYRLLKDLKYEKIAFSYGATFYTELVPHPNKDYAKALGRIYTITKLYNNKTISPKDRVHLLGSALPQEFGWYKDLPFIESIDTSNPIMAALDNVKYKKYGLDLKPKSNMNDNFNTKFEDIDYSYILHNVLMFKEINNL